MDGWLDRYIQILIDDKYQINIDDRWVDKYVGK